MEYPVLEIACLDLESGLVMGDFEDEKIPSTTLALRDAVAKTPLLIEKIFLSGTDNGGDGLIRAWSGLDHVLEHHA